MTPIVIIAGYLGSGKTTLLRHLIESSGRKLAILMNEFGEMAIDSRVVAGKNIRIAELSGGCVCCSLVGEFEAAIKEIIDTVRPDEIIVETTGLAEPDALLFDIRENLPELLVDAVVTVVDADATLRFPAIGHTGRVQIEMADLILLSKIDLVDKEGIAHVHDRLKEINSSAPIIETVFCRIDPDLIFGRVPHRERTTATPSPHDHAMASFQVLLEKPLDRGRFEKAVGDLPDRIYRAKGFVLFPEGRFLFNFVAGRYDLEPTPDDAGPLGIVFIGEGD
ncbi:MAG TPA: GTP-binding protein, partial [Nitrospiria bacterium]|nr:GTP-binding protein [Nitrospiria bacterium]